MNLIKILPLSMWVSYSAALLGLAVSVLLLLMRRAVLQAEHDSKRLEDEILEREQVELSLAHRVGEQTALYQFTDKLYRALSIDEIYDSALEAILKALGCPRASILLYDEGWRMRFVAWRGLSDTYRKAAEGHSPWKPDDKDPQPVYINDISFSDLSQELKSLIKTEGIHALAFIPLMRDGKLLGKFMTYYNEPHYFTSYEINLALNIARQLGFSIGRRKIEEERFWAQEALRENEASLKKINLELLDLTTHLEQRVEERTRQLAEQSEQLRHLAVELTEVEESERKRLAQILHDHLQQLLVAAKMRLVLIQRKETGLNKDTFDELLTYIEQAYESSRSLTAELRPPVLYEGGLVPALRFLTRKFYDQYKLRINLSVSSNDEPGSSFLKSMIYSSVQEMLFNIVKYAGVDECWLNLDKLPNHMIRVVVRDEGVGFDAQNIGKKGCEGFGLFSIRERLKALGGECTIESSMGNGTTFIMTIPDDQNQPKEVETGGIKITSSLKKSGKKAGQLTLLLADDHKIVRQSLAKLLLSLPFIHEVIEAEDGQDVIYKVHETNPDVVIMDLNMPHLNGIEATKILHQSHRRVKIIGLSVQTEQETMQAMKDCGAIAYFHKGEETDVLIEALKEIAQKKEIKRPAKRFGQMELIY